MRETLSGLEFEDPLNASTALIFVNGQTDQTTLERCKQFEGALHVCVDGGLEHCKAIGLLPDLLIGDLDSVAPDDVLSLDSKKTETLKHPVEKDATDLELTFDTLAARQVSQVVLVGIAGGRLDQTLANFMLLGSGSWPFSIHFMDANGDGTIIEPGDSMQRLVGVGRTISLLALSREVTGLTTNGFKYELENHTLVSGSTLGVSNVSKQPLVSVSVESGSLLMLINHSSP